VIGWLKGSAFSELTRCKATNAAVRETASNSNRRSSSRRDSSVTCSRQRAIDVKVRLVPIYAYPLATVGKENFVAGPSTGAEQSLPKVFLETLLVVRVLSSVFCPVRPMSFCQVVTLPGRERLRHLITIVSLLPQLSDETAIALAAEAAEPMVTTGYCNRTRRSPQCCSMTCSCSWLSFSCQPPILPERIKRPPG
jgi:hypothetical protein